MKWLALVLCLLASSLAVAQETPDELPPGAVVLPLVTICSETNPAAGLEQEFGEIGFVEGPATIYLPGGRTVNGKMKFFLNPDLANNTFSLMFEIGPLHCMIMSGKDIVPVVDGNPL